MKRTGTLLAAAIAILTLAFTGRPAGAAATSVVQGGAMVGANSPIIKILREPGTMEALKEGDTLYVFNEKGTPITAIAVKNVFSDEIHSEDLVENLAARLRDSGTILIYSNVPEYGAFIKAYLDGGEEAFRKFIADNPNSLLRPDAQKVVDGIVFRPYKLRGTIEALNEFIKAYPDNAYVESAVLRRDTLEYSSVKQADLIGAYRRFIALHPGNRFVPEAQARVKDILSGFEDVSVDQLAKASASLTGRKVKFVCYIHSILPIFVSGESVGKKTSKFTSPRPGVDYINLQVEGVGFILWRLFVSREDTDLMKALQMQDRHEMVQVFGQVFSNEGNAPWIDVLDLEPAKN
jgi:hypothetical protein